MGRSKVHVRHTGRSKSDLGTGRRGDPTLMVHSSQFHSVETRRGIEKDNGEPVRCLHTHT